MKKDFPTAPRFTVNKEVNPPEVWLHCSQCDTKIRQIEPNESVRITRAYFCACCDPGAIVLNPPH